MDYNVFFWDFDGVILDSNDVREFGFRKVLSNHPKSAVDKLIEYHRFNGGLSRYVKFRYFFEEILLQEISEDSVCQLANEFKAIMLEELMDKNKLINETVSFIQKNFKNKTMYIVSGSDEEELKLICKNLELNQYFDDIKGSPTAKDILIRNILKIKKHKTNDCVMIGDSINDYIAAKENQIDFIAFNNKDLIRYSVIKNFLD